MQKVYSYTHRVHADTHWSEPSDTLILGTCNFTKLTDTHTHTHVLTWTWRPCKATHVVIII